MTVTSRKYFTDWFVANGIIKDWGFDFTILSQDDVVVLVRDGTDDTSIVEYTTDLGFYPSEDFSSGSVRYPVLAAALPVGKQVRLLRRVAYLQQEKIGKEGKFLPQTHEKAFDKLTILAQQVDNDLELAVKVQIGGTPLELVSSLPDGAVLMKQGGFIVEGPSAGSINSAQAYAEAAELARDNAILARNKAQDWAEEAEDVEVEPGAYSSKHWSSKSEGFAGAADTAKTEVQALRDQVEALLATGRVPLGTIIHSAIPQIDNGFLLCDGAPVTALYPDLRAALIAAGSPFGTSGADPKLPDEVTASRFRRAANGSIPLGTVQDDQIQGHMHEFQYGTVPTKNKYFGSTPAAGGGAFGALNNGLLGAPSTTTFNIGDPITDGVNGTPRVGSETRPKSIAYLPYIKAFGAITIEGMADLAELLNAIATEAEAILGQNNTKLMTPLRARQSAIAVSGFEMIGSRITLAGQTALIWNNLSEYVELFLTIAALGSINTYSLQGHVSIDNGATWLTGGADYSASRIAQSGATVSGASTNFGHLVVNYSNSITTTGALIMGAAIRLRNFNKAARMVGRTEVGYFDAAGNVNEINTVWTTGAVARNAYRIQISTGNFASGYAALWGLKG